MTNHWIDVRNAKMILVCGGNPAENHPSVMQWVNQARAAGAKVVVADPRRTRMAAQADKHIRIRPGTNAAFMMGLANYAIANGRADTAYQTATETRTFYPDPASSTTARNVTLWPKWTDSTFQLNPGRTDYVRENISDGGYTFNQMPKRVALADPDSVWSVLTAQAAAYTSAVVADICDIPGGAAKFEEIADVVTAVANRPGTILYAMGGTQHSHASQDLRAYCILQLVLGNMGKAGGGVNALRGIHNVQGSTDQGVLCGNMPGYSDVPTDFNYGTYMNGLFGGRKNASAAYWTGLQQVGYRNMMYHYFRKTDGDDPANANLSVRADYESGVRNKNHDLMPKTSGYNHRTMFQKMASGTVAGEKVKCLVSLGQNPAVTEPNLTMIKTGLEELDTLVCIDMFVTETAACSRKSAGVTYLLPSAAFTEEEGSTSNSGRWIQWRYQAVQPNGGSKTDTEILLRLAKALDDAGAFSHIGASPGQYTPLYNDQYGYSGSGAINTPTVAETIYKQMCSGRTTTDEYGALWIYTAGNGGWQSAGSPQNRSKSRSTTDVAGGYGIYPNWGWAWIANRRIFYNNVGQTYGDITDSYFPAPDKVARIWVHAAAQVADYASVSYRKYSGLADDRIPKHHEPWETPRTDLLSAYPNIGDAPTSAVGSKTNYPLVLTTFRVTEHFQGGPTTRNVPWLCELVPDPVIEINSADAYARGISTGDNVVVTTARGSAGNFKAVVGSGTAATQRVKKGYVGVPWHWGNQGLVTGPSANDVTIDALDGTAKMPEYKACLCEIAKA